MVDHDGGAPGVQCPPTAVRVGSWGRRARDAGPPLSADPPDAAVA